MVGATSTAGVVTADSAVPTDVGAGVVSDVVGDAVLAGAGKPLGFCDMPAGFCNTLAMFCGRLTGPVRLERGAGTEILPPKAGVTVGIVKRGRPGT